MLSPSRLALARKRKGWTATRLARESGVSTRSLSLYENGHQHPGPDVLAALAGALEVRADFLTADDLDEIPVDAVSFRALSKMTARVRDRGLASGRLAMLVNEWIEARYDLPAPSIPSLTGHDPELAATEVRSRWGLGERPISNVIHLLEAHGVRVYSLTHDNTALDAFCATWHRQPYIFLGRQKSPERSRFDASHELGHLVLHGEDVTPHGPQAETEANRFAASFLMPRDAIRAQGLVNATAPQILQARVKWGVAAMAYAHRLNELGLMTEWAYRSACVDLSRMGYRRGEPGGLPNHESSQLLSKVMKDLRSVGHGISDIADDLGLAADEVRAHIFGLTPTVVLGTGASSAPSRPPLRVVAASLGRAQHEIQ